MYHVCKFWGGGVIVVKLGREISKECSMNCSVSTCPSKGVEFNISVFPAAVNIYREVVLTHLLIIQVSPPPFQESLCVLLHVSGTISSMSFSVLFQGPSQVKLFSSNKTNVQESKDTESTQNR